MAESIVVNGQAYEDINSINAVNEDGEPVMFYPDAVRYVEQNLTPEQKAQARTNIGAVSEDEMQTGGEVFIATYDTTTYQEILDAYNAGKVCLLKSVNHIAYMSICTKGLGCRFFRYVGTSHDIQQYFIDADSNWSTEILSLAKSVDGKLADDSGAVTINAVSYSAQKLSEEQQAQARANLGLDNIADAEIFTAIYDYTTWDELYSAHVAKKTIRLVNGTTGHYAVLVNFNANIVRFVRYDPDKHWIEIFSVDPESNWSIAYHRVVSSVDGVSPDNDGKIVLNAVTEDKLSGAIGEALAQAKESGEFDGEDGEDGQPGKDGISPIVTVSKSGKVTTVTITDAAGTKTATINDGADGQPGTDGKDGQDGTSVTVKSVSESTADGGSNVVTFSDGKTLTVKNGKTGETGPEGKNGAAGYTPVRGTDYWTEADKNEIKAYVDEAILGGAW